VREELPTPAAAAAADLLDKNTKVRLVQNFGHQLPATGTAGTAFHSLLLHAAPRRPACWRLQVLDSTCSFTGTKIQIIPMQLLIALAGTHFTCFTGTNVQMLTLLLLTKKDTHAAGVWVREEEGEAPARVRAWWGGGWKRSSAAPPASPLFAHAAACTALGVQWERSDGYTSICTSLA
jgi:hypothetical protein